MPASTEPRRQNSRNSSRMLLLRHWDDFIAHRSAQNQDVVAINGYDLSVAKVVAIARYGASIELAPEGLRAIASSAGTIKDSLSNGLVIYGVNTGFGGSADTRSSAVENVQNTLIRGLHYGILMDDVKPDSRKHQARNVHASGGSRNTSSVSALPLEDPRSNTCMPESWSRASMVVRLNSLASGASGIQIQTAQTLTGLIHHCITPCIPIRGSISASGDLSPLGYIGGAMQGKSTIQVWADDKTRHGSRTLMRADEALRNANLKPISLGPKEGLAIVNGTAVSAGVAALALHEAHCQAALSQVLTAMCVEALEGTDESFDPFIAQVRPHPGQIESARNIHSFLRNSRLVHYNDGKEDMTLRQDRYSIRTASQWVGPILEDLALAHDQISVELNSITDNPLIDTKRGTILHGGNFQAKAVSSAMEKTRAAMQTVGRLLFSQCTELINPVLNRGLPPNLVVDEPSTSFIFKGTDIMAAALTSELGFLASPVAPHVQTAEMGNQSINSLALISARYTLTAVDVLTQLSAAQMVALCQAFDLRGIQYTFNAAFKPKFVALLAEARVTAFPESEDPLSMSHTPASDHVIWTTFIHKLESSMNTDSAPRFMAAATALQPLMLDAWPCTAASISAIKTFTTACAATATHCLHETITAYKQNPDATPLLGRASRRMYTYLRKELEIPLITEELITIDDVEDVSEMPARDLPTVGGYITRVYEAMKNGSLYEEMVECFREVELEHEQDAVKANGHDGRC